MEEDWQGIKKTRYCSKIVILQVVPNMGQGRMEDLLSSTLEKAEKERWILPFKKLIRCLLRLLFVVFFFSLSSFQDILFMKHVERQTEQLEKNTKMEKLGN